MGSTRISLDNGAPSSRWSTRALRQGRQGPAQEQSSVTYAVQSSIALGVKAFKNPGAQGEPHAHGELLYRRARYLLDEATGLEQAARSCRGLGAEIHSPWNHFSDLAAARLLARSGRRARTLESN